MPTKPLMVSMIAAISVSRASACALEPSLNMIDTISEHSITVTATTLRGCAPWKAEAISAILNANGALLAYCYRKLVIEELVDASPRAEAAAAGKL